jgi:hypothetical protein
VNTGNTLAAALLLAVVGLATAAPLPEELKPPKRMAPTLIPVIAADTKRDGGEVTYISYVDVDVPFEVSRIVEKDGKKVPVKATEYRKETRAESISFRLDGYKLFTADGKTVPPAEVARRIVPGAVLLVAWDGELPEPAYLKLFKPETVVLVARARPGEPGGAVFPPRDMPANPNVEKKP